MKAYNITDIRTCVKRIVLLLLLGDLSKTCEKGKEKKFEREPKDQRKRGLKQKKMRERRRENKEGQNQRKRGIGQPTMKLKEDKN